VSASNEPDTAAVTREDEDDYDLLTFGEAGARLDHEIRAVRAQIAELEKRPPAEGAVGAALVAARNRLDTLVGAAERNARQPITDENFTRFFGYSGKARRNTT
jgi:hypothetical protein